VRPRRTRTSNRVFHLTGGTEDNDLWARQHIDQDGEPTISSTWELSHEERRAVAEGANIELIVWGAGTPPVCLRTTTEPVGKGPDS
jgi:hypothetical protein